LTFRYWLLPLAGEPNRAHLYLLGQRLAAGLHAAVLGAKDVALARGEHQESLPPTASLLRVDGEAVMTSLRSADGIELRLFNPLTTPTTARLRLGEGLWAAGHPAGAQRVDLAGHPLAEPSPFDDGELSLTLRAKEIVTLRLVE